MALFGLELKKRYFIIPSLIICFVALFFLLDNEEDIKQQIKKSITPKAEFIVDGFKLFESLKTGEDWNLKASMAEVYKDQNKTFLKVIQLVFYDNENKTFKLFSDNAVYNMSKSELTLMDNVRVESDDGYTLTTPNAVFYPNTQIITGNSKVTIEGPDIELNGIGFEGEVLKRKFSIFNKVITNINDTKPGKLLKLEKKKESIQLKVTAGKCEFYLLKNTIIYYQNVIGTGNGFLIKADNLKVVYQDKNDIRGIKEIFATGNVTINKDGKHSESDEAYLSTLNNNITLKGNPSIKEKNNVIRGNVIVYNYETKKMQINTANGIYKSE
jgi:LPS export ABC transporter protein LptC/lipopolysaccharide transport protein LptA